MAVDLLPVFQLLNLVGLAPASLREKKKKNHIRARQPHEAAHPCPCSDLGGVRCGHDKRDVDPRAQDWPRWLRSVTRHPCALCRAILGRGPRFTRLDSGVAELGFAFRIILRTGKSSTRPVNPLRLGFSLPSVLRPVGRGDGSQRASGDLCPCTLAATQGAPCAFSGTGWLVTSGFFSKISCAPQIRFFCLFPNAEMR